MTTNTPHANGIVREHRPSCPRTNRCTCPYSFWLPSIGGKRDRARIHGTLADAKKAKGEAEHNARVRRRQLANLKAGYGPIPTLSEWYDQLTERAWADTKPATKEFREWTYTTRIKPHLGTYRLDKLSPQVIESWLYERITEDGNRACVRHAYETLRTMLASATRHRIILENPVKLVPYPMRTLERRDLRVLTLEQYHHLLDAAHSISERTLLRVMTEAGLRRGETIALQVGDIDLAHGLIRVERRIYEQRDGRTDVDLPKSNRTRTVAINPTLVEELRQHLTERAALHPSDYVWVRQNTGTRHTGSTLTQTIYTIAIRAGLQPRKPRPGNGHWVSPHVLRRTGASIAAVSGVPVWITSQQLGHADIRTTQAHYLRLADPGQLAVYGEAFE